LWSDWSLPKTSHFVRTVAVAYSAIYGFLEDLNCSVDSEVQALILENSDVSAEGRDGATIFGHGNLIISRLQIKFRYYFGPI